MGGPTTYRIGAGWACGVASLGLGVLAFGAVLCLLFPAQLTTPELRAVYPMDLVRAIIQGGIVTAFALGLLNVMLGQRKRLGGLGIAAAVIAVALGGSEVPVEVPVAQSKHLSVDWFVLDLFLMAISFVPLERLFPRVDQPIFRDEFRTDLVYFAVGHVLIQVFVFFTVAPATALFAWALDPEFQRLVRSQPIGIQFVEIVVVSDLFFYWTHRLFHRVPFLWRVHAIHHSPRQMDWLAGSRLHVLEIVIVRAVMFTPLFVLGFSEGAVQTYVVAVAVHAVLLHANVSFDFGWLDYVVATPRYHQFHHATDSEALDKNFAVHIPVLDWIFGTQHLPAEGWPTAMGVTGPQPPAGYLAQLAYPFVGDDDTRSDRPE